MYGRFMLHSTSVSPWLAGDPRDVTVVVGQRRIHKGSKFNHPSCTDRVTDKIYNASLDAHDFVPISECVVNGSIATLFVQQFI